MVSGIAGVVFVAGLVAAAVVFAVGLERVWSVFGPPDLGPAPFETLERRSTPNDALACPPDLCRARADIVPPVFAVSAERLQRAMDVAIAAEPDMTQVEAGPLAERYIQRSRWMRFPDTIAVRYVPRGPDRSTVALYSRSQLGKGDLGVNKARIARWLDALSRHAPIAD